MNKKEISSKCPNCGSQLKYHTKEKKLKCISCDSTFEIESLGKGNLDKEEHDYMEMLQEIRVNKLTKKVVKSLNCTNCGAALINDGNIKSTICPFCGSNHIIEKDSKEEIIPITGIIPFNINKKECNEYFHKWIKSKFFAPNYFKKLKFQLDLYPVYLPYWTFDMECFTNYRAQRGDYYYEEVVKYDSEGNRIVEEERKIKWSYTSGSCSNSFDDIMVLGSIKQDNRYYIDEICNFDFKNMEKYTPEFLVGYNAEKISLPLEKAFANAKIDANDQIESSIRWDVGGDEVRILSTDTKYNDITFKQIMVPIYNGIYKYKGKEYRFVVNGQTGVFSGGSPVSGIKVFFFVLMIVLFVMGIVWLFSRVNM